MLLENSTRLTLSQMAQVMMVALFAIEESLSFRLLQISIKHLKSEYGCYWCNQMQFIQDF